MSGLCRRIGPVTFIEGYLIVVAEGSVYSLRLETNEDDVVARYHRLGLLGKVDVALEGVSP